MMGSFKLGKMTLRSLVKKPITTLYPFESKPQPKGLKGHIANDMEVCILCALCQRTCPSGAITIDKGAGTWSINRFRCVQCGSCTRSCPKSCLEMMPDYTKPTAEMSIDVFSKVDVDAEEKATRERVKAAKLEAALKANEDWKITHE